MHVSSLWLTPVNSVKLHPANSLSNIFGFIYSAHFLLWRNCRFRNMAFNPQDVNTYFPFENIACNRIKYYRFNELDEELIRREKKQRRKKSRFFPCVDLNDLTAITPKQTPGDNSCSFCESVPTDAVVSREDMCSPRRVSCMPPKQRCVWMYCCEQGADTFFFCD